jgi:hypothetical protein
LLRATTHKTKETYSFNDCKNINDNIFLVKKESTLENNNLKCLNNNDDAYFVNNNYLFIFRKIKKQSLKFYNPLELEKQINIMMIFLLIKI